MSSRPRLVQVRRWHGTSNRHPLFPQRLSPISLCPDPPGGEKPVALLSQVWRKFDAVLEVLYVTRRPSHTTGASDGASVGASGDQVSRYPTLQSVAAPTHGGLLGAELLLDRDRARALGPRPHNTAVLRKRGISSCRLN